MCGLLTIYASISFSLNVTLLLYYFLEINLCAMRLYNEHKIKETRCEMLYFGFIHENIEKNN